LQVAGCAFRENPNHQFSTLNAQPKIAGFVFVATDLKRVAGRGTGDEKMGGRGSCRAKTTASSERRIANSERQMATGEWRIANGEQRVASSFVWQCSCIAENFGLTTALSTSHSDWAHREVRPPKRRINSALRKIRHLAKASGMDRKILKGSHPALRTFMHTCTHARLHAYTPARGIVVDDEKLERRL
jgi:hypothetical protein